MNSGWAKYDYEKTSYITEKTTDIDQSSKISSKDIDEETLAEDVKVRSASCDPNDAHEASRYENDEYRYRSSSWPRVLSSLC